MSKQRKEKGTNSPKRIRRIAWTAVFLGVVACGATAAISLRTSQAKGSNIQPRAESLKNNTRSGSSLRSVQQQMPVDAQTGLIRPLTQEEAQQMAAAIKQLANKSTDGLTAVKQADGSVSVDLQGRFQNVIVARTTEDGKVVQSCFDDPASLAAFFGIDPQLVGAKPSGDASRVAPVAPAKGQDQ